MFAQGYIDGGDAPLLNNGNSLGVLEFPEGSVHFNIPDGIYHHEENHTIRLLEAVTVEGGVNTTPLKAEAHFEPPPFLFLNFINKWLFTPQVSVFLH